MCGVRLKGRGGGETGHDLRQCGPSGPCGEPAPGVMQHRHELKGSVLNIDHVSDPLPETQPLPRACSVRNMGLVTFDRDVKTKRRGVCLKPCSCSDRSMKLFLPASVIVPGARTIAFTSLARPAAQGADNKQRDDREGAAAYLPPGDGALDVETMGFQK